MSEEELQDLMDYNLEYLEARNSEDVFGGDYTSAVDLKYANKKIEQLEQENKQLKERIDRAIELLEKGITFCENDSQGVYDKCNIAINREKKVLEILREIVNE